MTQPNDEQMFQSKIASSRLELISLQTGEERIKQRIAELEQMIQSVLKEDSGSKACESNDSNDRQVI